MSEQCPWLRRHTCLSDDTAVFGASPTAREVDAGGLAAFASAFPTRFLRDSGTNSTVRIPYFTPLNGTLDGYLLNEW